MIIKISNLKREKNYQGLLNSHCKSLYKYNCKNLNYFGLSNKFSLNDSNLKWPSFLERRIEKGNIEEQVLMKISLGNHYYSNECFDMSISIYKNIMNLSIPKDLYARIYPFLCFSLGSAFLYSSLNRKKSAKEKEELYKSAFKYFEIYFQIRKITNVCEANFNMGRAYHFISMFKQAEIFYKEVLNISQMRMLFSSDSTHIRKDDNYYEKAAHNLALIERKRGNLNESQKLLENFL